MPRPFPLAEINMSNGSVTFWQYVTKSPVTCSILFNYSLCPEVLRIKSKMLPYAEYPPWKCVLRDNWPVIPRKCSITIFIMTDKMAWDCAYLRHMIYYIMMCASQHTDRHERILSWMHLVVRRKFYCQFSSSMYQVMWSGVSYTPQDVYIMIVYICYSCLFLFHRGNSREMNE